MFRTSKIYRAIARINRNYFINTKNRKRLKNHDFSIISSNCTGSLITHDLGERLLTPTVNLFITNDDFIKFVENLDFYLQQKIEQIFMENINYPVGKLGDIEIHFMHFKSISEAREKWYERSKRINYDNLYILMVDDGCDESIIQRFEGLPYKNKVFLTKQKYKQFESSVYIEGLEKEPQIIDLSLYKNIMGQKYYDGFNYTAWINNEI